MIVIIVANDGWLHLWIITMIFIALIVLIVIIHLNEEKKIVAFSTYRQWWLLVAAVSIIIDSKIVDNVYTVWENCKF
jgi:NADH:ubiquinone oxidoreductase subunit 5 (subunit L)/multisubunit Na+/H+ antiporter MnhA subunit